MICLAGAALGIYWHRQRRPLAGASAGEAPDLLSQIPWDAPVIAYVDVARLRALENSPLAAVLGLTAPGPQQDPGYSAFVANSGFDYMRDLDRAALAVWPTSLGSVQGQPPAGRTLAIGDGRFDQQKITAYALRNGWDERSHSLLEFPGPPPAKSFFLRFVSVNRAALSNEEALLETPANAAGGNRDPALRERIERVAGAPIFGVARTDNLPPSFYSSFRSWPQLERLIRSVRSVTLAGKPASDDIKFTLDGDCDSMSSAFQVATLLEGFRIIASAALADPKSTRELTREQAAFLGELLKRLKVDHQNHWVRLTLEITPAMLAAPAATAGRAPTRGGASPARPGR